MGVIVTAGKLYLQEHPEATVHELLAYLKGVEDSAIPPLEPQDINNNYIYKPIGERKKGTGKNHGGDSVRAQRGCRIPPDFHVTEAMQDFACIREGLGLDVVRRETENFVDYWQSVTGARAYKCDWVKAWRMWIRKVADGKNRQVQRTHGRRTVHDAARDLYREAVLREERGSGSGAANGRIPRPRED